MRADGGRNGVDAERLCYECAGVIGIDPGPLTLRQLGIMWRSRMEAEWQQTANILALLAEIHRDPKRRGRPHTAAEWNPFVKREQESPTLRRAKYEAWLRAAGV